MVLDNDGNYLVVLDLSFGELVFIQTSNGRAAKILTDVPFTSIVGITDKNELVLQAPEKIYLVSVPNGEIVISFPVSWSWWSIPNCVLDKTAIYCCHQGEEVFVQCQKIVWPN